MNPRHQVRKVHDERCVLPGHIFVPKEKKILYSIVTNTVLVCLYDPVQKRGGMAHFFKKNVPDQYDPTPIYALPAIMGLWRMVLSTALEKSSLEAHVIGDAHSHSRYADSLSSLAVKILRERNVDILSVCTGGELGRKVSMNTHSGEVLIARVSGVRKSDWVNA